MNTGAAAPEVPIVDPRAVRRSLAFVLLGGLIVVLDLSFRARGGDLPLDVINDTVGYALVGWGVVALARERGPSTYPPKIRFAAAVALASLAWSVPEQLVPEADGSVVDWILGALAVAGAVVFCLAMRDLLSSADLPGPAASWGRSAVLTGVLWGILEGIALTLRIAAEGAGVEGDPIEVTVTGPAGALLVLAAGVLAFTPLVHIAVSILRTRRGLRPAASRENI